MHSTKAITGSLQEIKEKLTDLENKMKIEIEKRKDVLDDIHISQYNSGVNLIRYLTLRSEDIRLLQDMLHIHGLSSLSSSESHILSQLQSILQRLGKKYSADQLDICTYAFSREITEKKSSVLFGKKPDKLSPYIMVTFDVSFIKNSDLIVLLLQNGMNVARINCAHDNADIWSKMIHKLEKACKKTGVDCKIYMDLAGPKIRTKLLSKGNKKGKVNIFEDTLIWLSDNSSNFSSDEIVIDPNEPGVIQNLKIGERVFIDDGKIKGMVEVVKSDRVGVRIIKLPAKKATIKNEKGINFPDSELSISSLTEYDKTCLPYICKHADMVGYSFVRFPADLANLQIELDRITSAPPNIIIKIETPEAVKNLPGLLLQGMQKETFGVMIARGDLAVEIGFERMGEIQEEILWICEAAHVPVIWATQVLENLNKSGIATRSEITDAARAAMAECVMVNKGEHTIEVIETLRDILHRIGGHLVKKRFTFRPLSIAVDFMK